MTSNSPSSRWSSEHGYRSAIARKGRRRAQPKRVHRAWWRARLTAYRLNRKYGDTLQVYSCYWGDDYRDGETAPRHWHLGHETQRDMWGY
jgi:hypothetical protein